MEKVNFMMKITTLNMMEIGLMIKKKDMEYIYGKMENVLKENGKMT